MYNINIGLFIYLILTSCDSKLYDNYTLFRGTPRTENDLSFFQNLGEFYDVIYWRRPGLLHKPVDFCISPEDQGRLLCDANEYGITLIILIEDIQRAFDEQTIKTYRTRRLDSFDWKNFYRLADIYNWLNDLLITHPRQLRLETIGKSVENRDIMAVKLSLHEFDSEPKVIVEGGIHAREWISPSFVTYMINELLNSPKSDNALLKKIAMDYEWIFVPILNPDGYEYSHTTNRMWRKNRRGDYGIDINRNFGVSFGNFGSSKTDRYGESYCGQVPFSEPETYAMAELTKANQNNLLYYFAFHSYGQYIIIPYSYSLQHEGNFDEVKRMGEIAARQISKRFGTEYNVGNAYDTVGYLASGASSCWAKKAFNVPYSVTVELRDTGSYGFALPPEQIIPTCEETMDGMLSFLRGNQTQIVRERHQEKKYSTMRPLTGGAKSCVVRFVLVLCCSSLIKFWF